jgi:hypothetical protein
MELEYFKKTVLNRFTEKITDQVFLFIENDKELFQEYLRVIRKDKNEDDTNIDLGYYIKNYFNLENILENNIPERCDTPESWLIHSYTKHKTKA